MAFVTVRGNLDDVEKLVMAQMFRCVGSAVCTEQVRGWEVYRGDGILCLGGLSADFDTALFGRPWLTIAIDSIWTIPKYLVGMGMILKIFEQAQKEIVESWGAAEALV